MNMRGVISATRIAVVAGALVLLAGCASNGASSFTRHTGSERTDAEYIAKVEQVARRRGVRIVWLNAPSRKPRGIVTDSE